MSVIDSFFDMVYIINMDKDVERLQHIQNALNEQNITKIARIKGIEINTSLNEIPYSVYRNFNKKDEKYVRGAIGCRLSHLLAVSNASENKFKRILIVEDDTKFLHNINELVTLNYNNILDFDMLYFGGLEEQMFRNQIVTSHCYGLTDRIYDDILNMAIPSGMEIDNFYAKILQHMSVNNRTGGQYIIKKVEPFNSVIQDRQQFKSNIQ